MTRTLLVGTTNVGKVRELEALLSGLPVRLVSLRDLEVDRHVDEDAPTFLGNAVKKAVTYAERSGLLALADDSGLEVDALGGAPGVRSARFAGEGATDRQNLEKLLVSLGDERVRTARFRCALAVAAPDGTVLATSEGTFEGTVADAPRGEGGFGYDPVFVGAGDRRTVAELPDAEKHAKSHRGEALRALLPELRRILGT